MAIVAIAGLAVVLDLVWKRVRGPPDAPPADLQATASAEG